MLPYYQKAYAHICLYKVVFTTICQDCKIWFWRTGPFWAPSIKWLQEIIWTSNVCVFFPPQWTSYWILCIRKLQICIIWNPVKKRAAVLRSSTCMITYTTAHSFSLNVFSPVCVTLDASKTKCNVKCKQTSSGIFLEIMEALTRWRPTNLLHLFLWHSQWLRTARSYQDY